MMRAHNIIKATRWLACFCLVFLFSSRAISETSSTNTDWALTAETALSNISNQLKQFDYNQSDRHLLAGFNNEVSAYMLRAQQCVNEQQPKLGKLKADITQLNQSSTSTGLNRKSSLISLNELANKTANRLKTCQTILLNAQNLANTIHDKEASLLAEYLSTRGEPLTATLRNNLKSMQPVNTSIKSFLDTRIKITSLELYDFIWFASAVIVAWFVGRFLGRRFSAIAGRLNGPSLTEALSSSFFACFGRKFALLSAATTATLFMALLLPLRPIPASTALFGSFTIYLVTIIFTRMLLWPCSPAKQIFNLDTDFSHSLYKRLKFILVLVLVAAFSLSTDLKNTLTYSQWELARIIFMTVTVINIAWLISYLSRAPGLLGNALLRTLVIITLLVAIGAELIGYRNLAGYLYRSTLGSIILAIALWLAHALFQDVLDSINDGRHRWGRKLREKLDLKKNQPVPGLLWVRLLGVLLIWMFFAISMLQLWRYSDNSWTWFMSFIQGGFDIGNMRIVPVQIAMGILLFVVILTFVRWFRQNTLPTWVRNAGLDRGGREAVTTISGYIGILLAALIGLSVAGFDFTNLAIIAGALSVGIGFGLQNIVNNFVSGLILLFERPIRTGDWIIVGNTEGFVRKISIRSTQIETFDHADVIVPNSELISNQVTNWMLHDSWGRIIVPVGVAYGSDVRKVEQILIDCAMNHPMIIKESDKVRPPMVRFCGFGDSSLDFELRAFISAIDKRFNVESELNFAIEKSMRENGIEIPFPQRDLHLRSIDPSIAFNQKPPE